MTSIQTPVQQTLDHVEPVPTSLPLALIDTFWLWFPYWYRPRTCPYALWTLLPYSAGLWLPWLHLFQIPTPPPRHQLPGRHLRSSYLLSLYALSASRINPTSTEQTPGGGPTSEGPFVSLEPLASLLGSCSICWSLFSSMDPICHSSLITWKCAQVFSLLEGKSLPWPALSL